MNIRRRKYYFLFS